MTDPSKSTPPAPGQPMHEETTEKAPQPTPAAAPAETNPTPSRHAATEEEAAVEAQDVEALLARHTFDGKGENAVPPASFRGFATEGVEKSKLKEPDVVAQEVLNGNWGPNAQVVAERLHAAGYTGEKLDAIESEFNRRKQSGAPSAF